MSLQRKYTFLAILFVIVGLAIFVVTYSRTVSEREKALGVLEDELIDGIKTELQTTTDVIAAELGRQIKDKTQEEAIAIIREVLQDIRFFENKSGYFFSYTRDHKVVALPPKPEKHGDDFSNLQDPNGVYIVREFVKIAQNGGGFLNYEYPKPGRDGNFPKLAFLKDIPGSKILIGTGVYIDDVDEKVETTRTALRKEGVITTITFMIGALVILAIVFAAGIITVSMLKALGNATEFMNRISSGSGDLTVRMAAHEKDELGRLGTGFNRFMEKLSSIITDLRTNISDVNIASSEMESTSTLLTDTADDLGKTANNSLGVSRELSNTINELSNTTSEVANDVHNVAAAVEELNASISEVARNCAKESEVTSAANRKSQEMESSVTTLRDASNEIGQVLEIISGIANQTNLLALNATIEAASAGEAGKGFAVVANEVKELAKQSADATDRIREQIEKLQLSSGDAIKGIEEIAEVILEIDNIANSIAAAVEEQSSSSSEISSLTSRVADSIQSVSHNAEQIKDASSKAVEGIERTRQLSDETASGAANSNASAQTLSEVSSKLTEISNQFKI